MGVGTGVSSNNEGGLLSGYKAYIDAENARLGEENARRNGQKTGFDQGYRQGFNEGQQAGYDNGWNDGIERGNKELWKADGYIKGHIADKERLQQTVNDQAQQIAQLLANVASLEAVLGRKDDAMRVIQDSQLPQMARELQAENEQLRSQVQALQADNEAKDKDCVEKAWQANRAATVLNAMRNTLEVLTADKKSDRTKEIEHLFCEQYKKEIATGLEKGYLREPLEEDAVFASTMPATHRFLISILQAVKDRIGLAGKSWWRRMSL